MQSACGYVFNSIQTITHSGLWLCRASAAPDDHTCDADDEQDDPDNDTCNRTSRVESQNLRLVQDADDERDHAEDDCADEQ